jgi:hypothetical protein
MRSLSPALPYRIADPAVLALARLAPPNPGTASYQAGAGDR